MRQNSLDYPLLTSILFFLICVGVRISMHEIVKTSERYGEDLTDKSKTPGREESLLEIVDATDDQVRKEVEQLRQEYNNELLMWREKFKNGVSSTQSRMELHWVEMLQNEFNIDSNGTTEFIRSTRKAIENHSNAGEDTKDIKLFLYSLDGLLSKLYELKYAKLKNLKTVWDSEQAFDSTGFMIVASLKTSVNNLVSVIKYVMNDLKYCRITFNEISIDYNQDNHKQKMQLKLELALHILVEINDLTY